MSLTEDAKRVIVGAVTKTLTNDISSPISISWVTVFTESKAYRNDGELVAGFNSINEVPRRLDITSGVYNEVGEVDEDLLFRRLDGGFKNVKIFPMKKEIIRVISMFLFEVKPCPKLLLKYSNFP